MIQLPHHRWRPTSPRELLLVMGIAVALALAFIVLFGYLFGWNWTGLPKQSLWDWLDLLIVPAVLALGGYLFTRSETRASLDAAERRTKDEALQAYLDQMSQLLLDRDLLDAAQPKAASGVVLLDATQRDDTPRTVARARTLTVLPRLDGDRKARVMQFLYEAGLITKDAAIVDLKLADLSKANLTDANLWGANLQAAYLHEANLSGAFPVNANLSIAKLIRADLSKASMIGADLSKANLTDANLKSAYLLSADLSEANLSSADLSEANLLEAVLLKADLTGASLTGANLTGADLTKTNLKDVTLSGADLTRVNLHFAQGWTVEQLKTASSLAGATLPNGETVPYSQANEELSTDFQNSRHSKEAIAALFQRLEDKLLQEGREKTGENE